MLCGYTISLDLKILSIHIYHWLMKCEQAEHNVKSMFMMKLLLTGEFSNQDFCNIFN